eukprot:COSAG02_NODE_193_length_29843_cov_30.519903_29_plen_105_part_00
MALNSQLASGLRLEFCFLGSSECRIPNQFLQALEELSHSGRTRKARRRYDEKLVLRDEGVDELMNVEFTRAMEARAAARLRRSEEQQREDEETVRASRILTSLK